MKPIVHWLLPTANISGLYSYTYQLHFKSLQMGYDSHICYFDSRFKDGDKLARFPNSRIQEFKPSPWSVSKGAINITHDQIPPFPLDNWVSELHGMPQYIARDIEHFSATAYELARAKAFLTRFPSQIPYWRELTDKPILSIPAGVDLDYWKPEGAKVEFTHHPTVLWADSWREGVKDPIDLLYAMKIVNREIPSATLKMLNIPSDKRDILHYIIGRLGLDSVIDWPIEQMDIRNISQYYRGADMLYSPTNEEGDNVVWEALTCGCPVIHKQDSPQAIANAILLMEKNHNRVSEETRQVYDIRKTVDAMMAHLEMTFQR